jgi:hypothetical protein
MPYCGTAWYCGWSPYAGGGAYEGPDQGCPDDGGPEYCCGGPEYCCGGGSGGG